MVLVTNTRWHIFVFHVVCNMLVLDPTISSVVSPNTLIFFFFGKLFDCQCFYILFYFAVCLPSTKLKKLIDLKIKYLLLLFFIKRFTWFLKLWQSKVKELFFRNIIKIPSQTKPNGELESSNFRFLYRKSQHGCEELWTVC